MSIYGDTDLGWLYIFSSPSTPYLKIGYTTNAIKDRCRQISQVQNVMFKFEEAAAYFVQDPRCAELKTMMYFDGYRKHGEFFDVPLEDVKEFIEKHLEPIDHEKWWFDQKIKMQDAIRALRG